jgi:hypothetical protein
LQHEQPALHWQLSPHPQLGLPHPDKAMVMRKGEKWVEELEVQRKASKEEISKVAQINTNKKTGQ